jgi:hypothetical protein
MRMQRITILLSLIPLISTSFSAKAFSGNDDKVCDVHKIAMQKDVVSAVCGLIVLDPFYYTEEYLRARKEQFPNSNREYYGGCVVDQNSTPTKEVLYCPKCREAEEQWGKEHPVITPINDGDKLNQELPDWNIMKSRKKKG